MTLPVADGPPLGVTVNQLIFQIPPSAPGVGEALGDALGEVLGEALGDALGEALGDGDGDGDVCVRPLKIWRSISRQN
jgi:hypothetical protein